MALQSNGGMQREKTSGANGTRQGALTIALRDTIGHSAVTPKMLVAIRQICADSQSRGQGPERSLIEFKISLTDAANEIEMPLGPDRSKLLAGLVSTFIAELYRPVKSIAKSRAFDCGDASQTSP